MLLGQHAGAFTDYDTAIRLDPNFAKVYFRRGDVNMLLGQTLEGKEDLHTALKLATQTGNVRIQNRVEQYLRRLELEKRK